MEGEEGAGKVFPTSSPEVAALQSPATATRAHSVIVQPLAYVAREDDTVVLAYAGRPICSMDLRPLADPARIPTSSSLLWCWERAVPSTTPMAGAPLDLVRMVFSGESLEIPPGSLPVRHGKTPHFAKQGERLPHLVTGEVNHKDLREESQCVGPNPQFPSFWGCAVDFL